MSRKLVLVILSRLVTISLGAPTAGTEAYTGALADTGCFAPKAAGGWGFCGPLSCKDTYVTCPGEGGGPTTVGSVTGTYATLQGTKKSASDCSSFVPRTTTADLTGNKWAPPGACSKSCVQKTTGVCSATFLSRVIAGDGVKYAYCNDKWLVIGSSGKPGVYSANLNDVPFPPGKDGTTQRTGMASLDETRGQELFYPLTVTDLSTSDASNNIAVWAGQTYLKVKDSSVSYGIPADGSVGMTVNGQVAFPIFNNNAEYTPAKCEVDSCNEHVGQGGGQPHYHGDPFSDQATYKCLYGPSNYSSITAHPPVIGFANDGHLIYGRYLSESAPGFASPLLDACGGHKHTAPDSDEHGFSLKDNYHYHTQVFETTCLTQQMCASGEKYYTSTTGPFKCFKADLSAQEGSSATLATGNTGKKQKNDMGYRCCGMTDYYLLTGVSLAAEDIDAASSCTVPPAPENGLYADDSTCKTAGAKMLSGHQCTPTCNTGFCPSLSTKCVKGVLTEIAKCVASTAACKYTAAAAAAAAAAGTGTTKPGLSSGIATARSRNLSAMCAAAMMCLVTLVMSYSSTRP